MLMDEHSRKERIAALLKKGILVSPDFLDETDENTSSSKDIAVLNQDAKNLLSRNEKNVNWVELEKVKVLSEKSNTNIPSIYEISPTSQSKELSDVQIVASYKVDSEKMSVSHFTNYFNTRYRLLEGILRSRPELQNLTAIKRLKTKGISNNLSIIGMINQKQETKNKNIMLTMEDVTGVQRVVISKNKPDLYADARDVVEDEVIGISGALKGEMFFANNVVFPDIPQTELKKSPDEEYMACMSDLHFGSKQFMPEEFERFLSWVNLEAGNQKQKEIAEKLKYIMIAGDIVDGAGIYQTQFDELTIKDVRDQYAACAKALSEIPKHIRIVVSPGNHDAVRMAEPQPPLDTTFSEAMTKLKNVILVSNPATVRIGVKENFPGFNCLLYHGYSFDHYVANVDSIRLNGGYERADLIMKFLLKRRHLAPTHTSTLITPTPNYDALFMETVPDFFITGHIHRTGISNYKATTLINSSCWQSMTSFQLRLGHNPQPARLPVINLKTRDATIIKFGK